MPTDAYRKAAFFVKDLFDQASFGSGTSELGILEPAENTTASCSRQCSAKQSDEQNILRGLLGLKSPGTNRTLHLGLKHSLKGWNLKLARIGLRGRDERRFRSRMGTASFSCSTAVTETSVGTAAIEPPPVRLSTSAPCLPTRRFPLPIFPFVNKVTVVFICGALLVVMYCFCITAPTLIEPNNQAYPTSAELVFLAVRYLQQNG
jgi:hypothetical protein